MFLDLFMFMLLLGYYSNKSYFTPKKYHPILAFTLVYQPFALITTLILAHYESKISTRMRNLSGYATFFVCSLLVLVVSTFYFHLHWFSIYFALRNLL